MAYSMNGTADQKLIKMNQLIEELSKSKIPNETIEKIMGLGKLVKVKSQTKLVRHNQVCTKVYLVLKGGFVCRFIDEALEIEKTINFFFPEFHPFMTCVDSFFSETKTQCEIRCISNAEVIEFDKKDMETLIFRDLQLLQIYHAQVTTALQEINDFEMKIIAYSSERLYHYLITTHPIIIQQVPAKYIAEFMGISSEWLSKLKHRI